MISTLKKLQEKKAAQELNGGFTLIELLIVIVVLGILAAVVVFSLGNVTGQSAVAACQADGATVETAIAAYNAQNVAGLSTVGAAAPLTMDQNEQASLVNGGYLVSFPNNTAHYLMGLKSGVLYVASPGVTTAAGGLGWHAWSGAGTCTSSLVK